MTSGRPSFSSADNASGVGLDAVPAGLAIMLASPMAVALRGKGRGCQAAEVST